MIAFVKHRPARNYDGYIVEEEKQTENGNRRRCYDQELGLTAIYHQRLYEK
jgi:hypothetical protein